MHCQLSWLAVRRAGAKATQRLDTIVLWCVPWSTTPGSKTLWLIRITTICEKIVNYLVIMIVMFVAVKNTRRRCSNVKPVDFQHSNYTCIYIYIPHPFQEHVFAKFHLQLIPWLIATPQTWSDISGFSSIHPWWAGIQEEIETAIYRIYGFIQLWAYNNMSCKSVSVEEITNCQLRQCCSDSINKQNWFWV